MSYSYGVLTDEDIIREASNGSLIAENFDKNNVKQACYELRASSIYYDLSAKERRHRLSKPDDHVLLKPYQLAVLITLESLDVPNDVICRILMKGRLFSLGLLPVNTYADPGFSGRLGIVIYNGSPNYVGIPQGSAIAKIEFERLSKPVRRAYAGQHGYQTEIWPIPTDMILTPDQIKRDPRIKSPIDELRSSFGGDFGAVVERVFRYERLLILSTTLYVGLSTLIVIYSQSQDAQLSTLTAFVLGLITNLASGILMYAATKIRRKRSRY
ncbi:hypothetical protein Aple_079660 [Acrocarpospora pleiomorpha]|uniref:Uncharacterized protein n=1 Tax=Acrocarpospora pleiomorpha TaxID=90975 RepID=A0A5M3XV31_9ACTN|nr:hypothetical protein [Acrocarpospora pleiomorpha]GES25067.1 hypothetical protein Aple_079660 [Acrocarpospora pleiomorpha]